MKKKKKKKKKKMKNPLVRQSACMAQTGQVPIQMKACTDIVTKDCCQCQMQP